MVLVTECLLRQSKQTCNIVSVVRYFLSVAKSIKRVQQKDIIENGIRGFISGIIAVISVLVILAGTYMTSSGIKNCKWKLSWRIQEWWRIRLYGRIWTMEKTNLWQIILKRMLHYYIYITALSQLQMNSNSHMIGLINSLYVTSYTAKDLLRLFL